MAILLVVTAMLALIHCCYLSDKFEKLDYVYLLVLLIVMGFNSDNADYAAYERIYQKVIMATSWDGVMQAHVDKGYVFLNWMSAFIGLDYRCFHFGLFALLLVSIFIIAKKMGTPICVLYLAYMMYPMFMDIIQIRNFIISVVVLFSVYCYSHDDIRWYTIGVMSLMISVTIHPFVLMFIPFVVFYKVYQYSRFRRITYVPIGLGLLSIAIKMIIDSYWNEVTAILTMLADWASRGHSYVGHQVLTSRQIKIYLVVVIFTWLLYKAKTYLSTLECVTELQKRFVDISFVAYLYLICWMPLFALDITLATRMPRDLFLLAYMSLGIYVSKCTFQKKKMGILLGMMFLAFFFGLVDLYISTDRFNVDVILTHNWLL